MAHNTKATILVVEDEPGLVESYTAWLQETYTVRTALTGDRALRSLDDQVDIVLLDRQLPDLPGEEVLREIRELGIDCRVAMVTSTPPEVDILDLPFDDYLVKPVTKEEVRGTIERLLIRSRFSEYLQEYHAVATKKALIETEVGQTTLEASAEYDALTDRLKELERRLEMTACALEPPDWHAIFSSIGDSDTRGDSRT